MKVVLAGNGELVRSDCKGHSEACRRRTGSLLRGDSSGSARLAATDERINRALADSVERDATKDPGTRGRLKRASVVRHSESEPQKARAPHTEEELPPHTAVSYGGSSASGTQPSIATALSRTRARAMCRERR